MTLNNEKALAWMVRRHHEREIGNKQRVSSGGVLVKEEEHGGTRGNN